MKYEIPVIERNKCGSHLALLNEVLSGLDKKITVFEFGCGEFSTLTFLNCEMVDFVYAMEMQSSHWGDKLRTITAGDRISLFDNLDPDSALQYASNFLLTNKIDLVFVDGHKDNRPECVNAAFAANVPIIVIHDFEEPVYGWTRIVKPDNYSLTVQTSAPYNIQTAVYKKYE